MYYWNSRSSELSDRRTNWIWIRDWSEGEIFFLYKIKSYNSSYNCTLRWIESRSNRSSAHHANLLPVIMAQQLQPLKFTLSIDPKECQGTKFSPQGKTQTTWSAFSKSSVLNIAKSKRSSPHQTLKITIHLLSIQEKKITKYRTTRSPKCKFNYHLLPLLHLPLPRYDAIMFIFKNGFRI